MIVHIPEKAATPTTPTLEKYDSTLPISATSNFRKLQRNTILLVNYANSLRDTVDYYEHQIDDLQQLQAQHTENTSND